MRHYTRLHRNSVTAKVPKGFDVMVKLAKEHDFSDGHGMVHGDALCWPIGKEIYAYVEGSRFGFIAFGDEAFTLPPVQSEHYFTREIPNTSSVSTQSEIKLIDAASLHKFSDNNSFRAGSVHILPLGHGTFTFLNKSTTKFGFFFKPSGTSSPSR